MSTNRARSSYFRLSAVLNACLLALFFAVSTVAAPSTSASTNSLRTSKVDSPHSVPYVCPTGFDLSGYCHVWFFNTNSIQSFTVPAGVSSIEFILSGGYGGGYCAPYLSGGTGGGVNGTIPVSEGETFHILAGGMGANASTPACTGWPTNPYGSYGEGSGIGGFGGGGNGGTGNGAAGGGGGGGSFVWGPNTVLEFVAGGGGGAGQGPIEDDSRGVVAPPGVGGAGGGGINTSWCHSTGVGNGYAGLGGSSNSTPATDCTLSYPMGGRGATKTTFGAGAPKGLSGPVGNNFVLVGAAGRSGSGPAGFLTPGFGGAGGGNCTATQSPNPPFLDNGGGGGGGYFGGGGGGCSANGDGGGGGSSYAAPDATGVTFANTVNPLPSPAHPTSSGYFGGWVGLKFQVCGSASQLTTHATTGLSGHVAIAHSSGPSCPLDVSIGLLGHARSGLAVNNLDPTDGPVNFTTFVYANAGTPYTEPNSVGEKCHSGCVNLLVTVTNPITNKPVANASVEALVRPPTSIDRSKSRAIGHEFLCLQTDQSTPRCGAQLNNLTTDQNGHLHLLYWSPGIYPFDAPVPWPTDVEVIAKKDICHTACIHQEGMKSIGFAVQPYLIYQHTGTLSRKTVEDLIEIVNEGPKFFQDKAKFQAYETLTEPLIVELENLEKAALATALKSAGPAIETVHIIYLAGESYFKLGQQFGLIADLLDQLGMPGIGIGPSDPLSRTISDQPTDIFRDALLSGVANVLPVGQGGVLWSDGEALALQLKNAGSAFSAQPEKITVKVFEVSHCNMNLPKCGAGYWGSPGIRPEICLAFSGSNSFPNALGWKYAFCQEYNAPAFVWTQRGINRTLP